MFYKVVTSQDMFDLWDRVVYQINIIGPDKNNDPYFLGMYESMFWMLGMLSVSLGKTEEYAALCVKYDRQGFSEED